MKAAWLVVIVGLASCSAANDEYHRVTKKAIADCEALGGRPKLGVAMGSLIYHECDFELNRERERLGRINPEQPRIGSGTRTAE